MCVAKNEPGGPKRCSADQLVRVQQCGHDLAAHSNLVDDLVGACDELDDELQTLTDMQAALDGTLTQQREVELLIEAAAYLERIQPLPEPATWQQTAVGQIAHVDQAWAETEPWIEWTVDPTSITGDPFEMRQRAISQYEQAVLQVGATVGAEADRRVEERLNQLRAAGRPVDDLSGERDRQLLKVQTLAAEVRAGRAHRREYLAARRKLIDVMRQSLDQMTPTAQVRAEVYREVLAEVRPLGGARPTVRGRPKAEIVTQLEQVADDMPAEWITDINDRRPPLTLSRQSEARAHYTAGADTIVTEGLSSSMYHEYAHRIEEQHPAVWAATNEFLRRRTTGVDGNRELPKRYGGGRSDELIRPDGFVDGYIGKEYDGMYTEVFSCGNEALFRGSFGGLVGDNGKRADLEHRNLMLGLYASAKASTR